MARGFARRGKGRGVRYAARLDQHERALLVELFTQTRELITPGSASRTAAAEDVSRAGDVDPFDAIVAGLGEDFGSATAAQPSDGLAGRGFGGEDRDPALDRLFPAGNRSDEEAAKEFRRLTEASLRSRKVDGLNAALTSLGAAGDDRLELTPESARAFLVALTDVRLVLGERRGLREDADAERLQQIAEAAVPQHPTAYAIVVYDFLTWLQETLATSMLPPR